MQDTREPRFEGRSLLIVLDNLSMFSTRCRSSLGQQPE
jgi:hypothetical protein